MYFFKIKYRDVRTYKTIRTRSTISKIFMFLLTLPFGSLSSIEKIKIERINDYETSRKTVSPCVS